MIPSTGYKVKKSTFMAGGVQTMAVKPTLSMGVNEDILDQNLGKPLNNVEGVQ